jgi:hypothetical protein
MPAAAILVNPADAVDCEFLNLDFLKDTRFFTACYCCPIFYFHVILLSFIFAPLPGALWYAFFIATVVPINITLICSVISGSSELTN